MQKVEGSNPFSRFFVASIPGVSGVIAGATSPAQIVANAAAAAWTLSADDLASIPLRSQRKDGRDRRHEDQLQCMAPPIGSRKPLTRWARFVPEVREGERRFLDGFKAAC